MTLNRLDGEGLPAAGIERKLARHFLRADRLAGKVLFHWVGGPRGEGELLHDLPTGPTSLANVLKRLRNEGVIIQVADARPHPPRLAYKLTTLGLVVVEWMRRAP